MTHSFHYLHNLGNETSHDPQNVDLGRASSVLLFRGNNSDGVLVAKVVLRSDSIQLKSTNDEVHLGYQTSRTMTVSPPNILRQAALEKKSRGLII